MHVTDMNPAGYVCIYSIVIAIDQSVKQSLARGVIRVGRVPLCLALRWIWYLLRSRGDGRILA